MGGRVGKWIVIRIPTLSDYSTYGKRNPIKNDPPPLQGVYYRNTLGLGIIGSAIFETIPV